MSQRSDWNEWVASRPQNLQVLIALYPPGEYVMNQDAPYGVSCPGTKVYLHSYNENGTIGVIVTPENKLPAAYEHEKYLAEKHGKLDKLREIHAQAVKVFVDPQYVTLVKELEMEE